MNKDQTERLIKAIEKIGTELEYRRRSCGYPSIVVSRPERWTVNDGDDGTVLD